MIAIRPAEQIATARPPTGTATTAHPGHCPARARAAAIAVVTWPRADAIRMSASGRQNGGAFSASTSTASQRRGTPSGETSCQLHWYTPDATACSRTSIMVSAPSHHW
jgi:hypothetical protein